MRPLAWIRGAAREWPLALGALAVASLSVFLLPLSPPAPAPRARPRAAAPPEDPVALLRRGARLLRDGTGDPFPPLIEGLLRVRSARDLDRPGFNVAGFVATLRSAWERESDPERLARFGRLVGEIRRIYPDSADYAADLGNLWRRAGREWDAAAQFAQAARLRRDPPGAARAAREAAETYARGGFFRMAADLFGGLRQRDASDAEALFRRAECLMQAGLWEPDAMAAFEEYIERVRPGDPLLPRALLARGVMLAGLGRTAEALGEFDRILRDPRLGIDPRAEEWGEALLQRGRALLETADGAPEPRRRTVWREARQAFEEYLDRYAVPGPLGPRALEAGAFLVRVRIAEGEWQGALDRLDDVLSRLPSMESEEGKDLVLELRFLRGSLLSLLGRHEEAARAFGAAYRRHSTDPERLWGLVGRARALLRLGRKEEARADCERARAVYESERRAFDRSLAGRGREYWRGELDALAKEVQ